MQSNRYKPHYKNVPQSWVICKLADVCYVESGYAFSSDDYSRSGTPLVRISNIIDSQISLESCVYINSECDKRFHVKKGDLLIAMSGATTGKMGVYDSNETAFLNQRVGNIKVINENVLLNDYRNIFMYSQIGNILELAYGGAQPNISANIICSLPIPIPSIKEQKRIIMAVGKWFSLIDTLETAKEDLQTSIEYTKSKILDLAIHGKLVPQDPNDEPAIELLKRINPKFTPCDNAHYENVPSNWTAILLGDLCFTINGLWKGKKPPFVNVRVIRNANFTKDCKLDYSNIAYLEVEAKQYEKRKLQYGDIIVEKSGGSDNQPVGRTILFEKTEGEYSFSNFTSVLRIYDGYPALPEYLNMYLQAVYQTGITKRMQTQTTGIHNLIFDQFLAIPIKLPPLVEQRRIINKVSELSQILDNISAEL